MPSSFGAVILAMAVSVAGDGGRVAEGEGVSVGAGVLVGVAEGRASAVCVPQMMSSSMAVWIISGGMVALG
jgi:hypothetical protein